MEDCTEKSWTAILLLEGSNVGNSEEIEAESISCHNRKFSLNLTLPHLPVYSKHVLGIYRQVEAKLRFNENFRLWQEIDSASISPEFRHCCLRNRMNRCSRFLCTILHQEHQYDNSDAHRRKVADDYNLLFSVVWFTDNVITLLALSWNRSFKTGIIESTWCKHFPSIDSI